MAEAKAKANRTLGPANQTHGPAKPKVCFVITPIGDDASPTRRAIDGLVDAVIETEALRRGLTCEWSVG